MAKTIVAYSAVMTSTDYIFDRPDSSGDKTQYDYGTELRLPADYASRENNGFYPVTYPENGWVRYYVVGSISPIYETTTDKCKAPTSVTLNTSTKTIAISGGAGGDLNTFTGYGVSWRDAKIGTTSYGAWSSDVTVTGGTTVKYTVSAPNGYIRQFRVRTLGSAGESYYSDYVVCDTTLTANVAPSTPTILKPVENTKTFHASPIAVIECAADPDKDAMTLFRQIDNGSWVAVSASPVGTVYDQLPALGIGQHTVSYKLADPYAESAVSKRTFTVADHLWSRTIKTGDVISNPYISHRNDITEMLSAINTQRAFYGIGGISLTGVGNFKSWALCMQTLLNGINACRTATGLEAQALDIPAYPTALVINTIRLLTIGVPTGNESNSENKLDYAILDQMFLA